ncbi:MAG: hypothetical protein JRG89_24995 [Deltaproteobacteria bacterium]|nr:hypothetical protein [Deltaproteobacteria bacterium]
MLDERFHERTVAEGRTRTSMKIAIQSDDYTAAKRPEGSDASSPRWAEAIQAAGHEVRWVDVHRADILDQVRGCQGFMWRWAHFGGMSRIARRLLPVLENELGLCVYPDQKTCWHYDDKIAQSYLLESLGIPIPKTWVFYDRQLAIDWSEQATYPLVIKLSTGAGSSNVHLVSNAGEAGKWIETMFGEWNTSLDPGAAQLSLGKRVAAASRLLASGRAPSHLRADHEPQRGYVLFQEFLSGNEFDTRVTVIGTRAFGFRRLNREGDFRASGSGRLDYDQDGVDLDAVHLAYATAAALGAQSVAIDGLIGNSAERPRRANFRGWTVRCGPRRRRFRTSSRDSRPDRRRERRKWTQSGASGTKKWMCSCSATVEPERRLRSRRPNGAPTPW